MKTCDESGHLPWGKRCFHEAARPDRPLLVGESNPYSLDPRCALLPWPVGATGDRLRSILGLTEREYLHAFDRVNLCRQRWNLPAAREEARRLAALARLGRLGPLVLLGRRVATAFGFGNRRPWTVLPLDVDAPHLPPDVFLLPHPSGRCREWSAPGAVERARLLLAAFLPPAKNAAGGKGEVG